MNAVSRTERSAVESATDVVNNRGAKLSVSVQNERLLLIQQGALALAKNYIALADDLPFGGRVKLLDKTTPSKQELLCQALLLNPNSSEGHIKLGITIPLGDRLNCLGKVYTRQGCFIKAVQVDPSDADAHFHLATTLPSGGSIIIPDESKPPDQNPVRTDKQLYQKTLQINPRHAAALYQLGLLVPMGEAVDLFDNFGTKRTLNRIELLTEAIQIDPRMSEAYYPLVCSLPRKGHVMLNRDSTSDTQLLRKLLRLNPSCANTRYELAMRGFPEELSLEEKQQLLIHEIKINPTCADAYFQLANTLKLRSSINLSTPEGYPKQTTRQALLEETLKLKPDYAKAYNNLARELRPGEKVKLSHKDHKMGQLELLLEAQRCDPTLRVLYQNIAQLLPDNGSVILADNQRKTKEELKLLASAFAEKQAKNKRADDSDKSSDVETPPKKQPKQAAREKSPD